MENSAAIEARRKTLIEGVRSKAPIVTTYGMTLHYNERGQAVWKLPYNSGFDHGLGSIHGSVFAMLIDNGGWFTAAPYYENWISTVEFDVRLLEPAQQVDLTAVGTAVRVGRRIATATTEVFDAEGKLIALGSGTYTVTSLPFVFGDA